MMGIFILLLLKIISNKISNVLGLLDIGLWQPDSRSDKAWFNFSETVYRYNLAPPFNESPTDPATSDVSSLRV